MSETSIQSRPNTSAVAAPPLRPKPSRWRYLHSALRALASLRLTVFLFVLSMILVFCGTLAMMDQGLYTVLSRYFRSYGIVWLPMQLFVRFGQVFFGVSPNLQVTGSIPFPGGWLIGGALLINLLAAHITRFRLTWKRSGILILHAGVVLLMVGEWITGQFAVEGAMTIPLGGTSNYVENFDAMELAFVWPKDDKQDNHVVIPDRLLRQGAVIRDERLPVDIEVLRYMANSSLSDSPGQGEENLATRGFGLRNAVVEQPPGRGVDAEQKRDMPSAYLDFKDKKTGKSLGVYLASALLIPQKVTIDGTPYQMALRLQRTYRPFTFQLLDLKDDTYHGTTLAKRYASKVRVTGESGLDRESLIHMNHPLYFDGESFYQSGVNHTMDGHKVTILQAVRNPGWLLPYIACTMVAVGMAVHFFLLLMAFLRRVLGLSPQQGPKTNMEFFGPWVFVGVAMLYLFAMMAPAAESADRMRLQEFAALPIEEAGRVKPIDSLARNSLMIISGRDTFVDQNNQKQPAIRWLLDVMTRAGDMHQVFRIDNPEVVTGLLGLERRKSQRYALAEFHERLEKVKEEAQKIGEKDPKRLTAYEKGVADLVRHWNLYLKLEHWPQTLYLVPPSASEEQWRTLQEVHGEIRDQGDMSKLAMAMMIFAYSKNDAAKFNQALDAYQKELDQSLSGPTRRSGAEEFFNHFEPFFQCGVFYVLVLLLGCVSWWWQSQRETLRRTAFWLAALTLVVHSVALIGRMYLMNRWFVFVTNLYSSAIFIGWGCVALGLVLERLFRNGIGLVAGSLCGALTMPLAHHLGSDGDTLALLLPVLDTNFWLMTHVTCVASGYTATLVAGVIGMIYILAGVLTPALDRSLAKVLNQMLYGVLCFATLLSFTGTVLGGIWADQSWGRFWGWDPKENGALLIVIWNALILHARWGGLVKQRGLAVLAVIGNVVVAWSYFGTNQLGVGLHAYGFNDTLSKGLVGFWISQGVLIGLGLLPQQWWTSYAALTAPVPAVEAIPPQTEHPRRRRRGGKRGDTGFFSDPS